MTHIYRWNRPDAANNRKGQPCRLICRGRMNSILVEFADGFRMVTSGNAIRRAPAAEEAAGRSGRPAGAAGHLRADQASVAGAPREAKQ